jgi:hypothetical protein
MKPRSEDLSFGGLSGRTFRLEVRQDSMGELHLRLFRGREEVAGLFKPTLPLLRYMAERPNKDLRTDQILDELWPESGRNIVEKHVSFIRSALGDTKPPEEPVFIKTIHGDGYKFLPEVTRSGELGDLEAYPEWWPDRFTQLLRQVERGTGPETEDLRIVSSGISTFVSELRLERLIAKGRARVRILLMNPANEALINARYLLRKDKPYERNVRELKEQIAEIQDIARRYPPSTDGAGSLELLLSDTMPSGCMFHAANWALLGIFLAHESYSKGPMIEARGGSDPWKMLYDDWQVRWDAAVIKKRQES